MAISRRAWPAGVMASPGTASTPDSPPMRSRVRWVTST